MKIYDALMAAAAQVEKHPDTYWFQSNSRPACGTPGCMIGVGGPFSRGA